MATYNPNDPKSTLEIPRIFRIQGGTNVGYFDPKTGKIAQTRWEDLTAAQKQGIDFNSIQQVNYSDVLGRVAEAYGYSSLNAVTDDALSQEFRSNFQNYYNQYSGVGNTAITKDLTTGQSFNGETIGTFSVDGQPLTGVGPNGQPLNPTPAQVALNSQPNFLGGSYSAQSVNVPTEPLSSSTFKVEPSLNYQPSTTPSVFPVGTLPTPTSQQPQLGETQNQAQKLNEYIQGLYSQTLGRSVYQTQQNTQFGVDIAQKSITDYAAQLNALKMEAASFSDVLSKGAAERGVTSGLFSAQYNYLARENSIASLRTAALMSSAQGNLANAQMMADKAVAQKYDPIEEQIRVATANLQLILNSPKYDEETKARARAQLEAQNKKEDAVQLAKERAKQAYDMAIEAGRPENLVNFKPSSKYSTATLALQAMANSGNPLEAQRIAAEVGLTTTKVGTSSDIIEYNLVKSQGYKGTFQQWLDRNRGIAGTVTERLLQSQRDILTKTGNKLNSERSISKDGFANPDTYRKAKADYIAAGGNATDFFQSYPVEVYISPENRKGDLGGATSGATVPKGSLNADQQSIINDAKSRLDIAKQRYEDVNAIRAEIIRRSIEQFGFDPSPYL